LATAHHLYCILHHPCNVSSELAAGAQSVFLANAFTNIFTSFRALTSRARPYTRAHSLSSTSCLAWGYGDSVTPQKGKYAIQRNTTPSDKLAAAYFDASDMHTAYRESNSLSCHEHETDNAEKKGCVWVNHENGTSLWPAHSQMTLAYATIATHIQTAKLSRGALRQVLGSYLGSHLRPYLRPYLGLCLGPCLRSYNISFNTSCIYDLK